MDVGGISALTLPSDVDPAGLEVTQGYMPMMWDLFNEPFDIRPDGTVHAPDQAGLGFTLRADALERFRYVDGPEYEF